MTHQQKYQLVTSFLFESIWCFVLVCGLGVLTFKKPIESLPRIKQGLNFRIFLCGAGDSDVLPLPKEPSDVLLLPFRIASNQNASKNESEVKKCEMLPMKSFAFAQLCSGELTLQCYCA